MSNTVVYLLFIFFSSIAVAWFFSYSKQVETAIKVMTFMIYFWLVAFAQLMVFGLLYHYKLLI